MYSHTAPKILVSRKQKKTKTNNNSNRNKSKRNNKSNRNTKKIKQLCYSGTGAKKNTNMHSVEEFLKIMETEGKEACAKYKKSLNCKPCQKRKKLLSKINRKRKLKSNYKPSNKLMNKEEKLFDECLVCQENFNELCDLNEYIEWSGAKPNKC